MFQKHYIDFALKCTLLWYIISIISTLKYAKVYFFFHMEWLGCEGFIGCPPETSPLKRCVCHTSGWSPCLALSLGHPGGRTHPWCGPSIAGTDLVAWWDCWDRHSEPYFVRPVDIVRQDIEGYWLEELVVKKQMLLRTQARTHLYPVRIVVQ